MKKITLLITVFLISVTGFSQTYDLLQSFDGTGLEGVFGGTSAMYDANPAGGAGQVVKVTSNPGEVWQGVNVDNFTSNFTLTSATQLTMQLDVYSSTPITIAPKAQGGIAGAPESVTTASHSGNSTWQTLTFTFNQSLDGKVPANGSYADFALHINWNIATNGFGAPDGRVFYIRNLRGLPFVNLCTNGVQDPGETGIDCGGSCPPCAAPPTTAAPTPPNRPTADVISLYSGAYTNVASNFDAGWCGASSVQEVMIAGNPTMAFKGNNCQGIVLDAGIDASTFTRLHVDIYIEAGTDLTSSVFNLKFVQQPGGAALEINLNIASTPPLVAGSWIQVDIPVNLVAFTGFKEFGITSNLFNKVWYDNLYAHKNTVLSNTDFELAGFNAYPNPSNNVWNITAKQNITSIELFDVTGKIVMALNPNTTEATINAAELSNGIYFAKVSSDANSKTIKLIKN